MQRRRENRVRSTKRQLLGLRDEGRGRVVDENVDRPITPDRIHHRIDCDAIADVAALHGDLAAGTAAHVGSGRFQQFQPAPADHEVSAKLQEAAAHRRAEPGAAAGDQDALSLQQAFFKHCFLPPDGYFPSS
jgi:hypothetical protein